MRKNKKQNNKLKVFKIKLLCKKAKFIQKKLEKNLISIKIYYMLMKNKIIN